MEHCSIEDTGVEEEYPKYLLAIFGLGWGEIAFFGYFGPLDFGTIIRSGKWSG